MIAQRVKEEDCNAGVIFDNLESPYWPNLKVALEAICEALPTQNVQVLLLQFAKEQAEPDPADEQEVKPKDHTKEEQEAYAKFAEEANNAFAEILLRQMNPDQPPTDSQPEGVEHHEGEAAEGKHEEEKPSEGDADPAAH